MFTACQDAAYVTGRLPAVVLMYDVARPTRSCVRGFVSLRRGCWYDAHDRVVAVCRDDLGFPAQAVGVAAFLDGAYTSPDVPPKHTDLAVSGAQMLQIVDGNGPLSDLRLIISGATLAGLVRVGVWKLAREHDGAIGPPLRGALRLTHVSKFDEHRVGIIHRHDPAAHHGPTEGMLAHAIFPNRRHLLQVGRNDFYHPGPDVLLTRRVAT